MPSKSHISVFHTPTIIIHSLNSFLLLFTTLTLLITGPIRYQLPLRKMTAGLNFYLLYTDVAVSCRVSQKRYQGVRHRAFAERGVPKSGRIAQCVGRRQRLEDSSRARDRLRLQRNLARGPVSRTACVPWCSEFPAASFVPLEVEGGASDPEAVQTARQASYLFALLNAKSLLDAPAHGVAG